MTTNFAYNVVQNALISLKENENWSDEYCSIFTDLITKGLLNDSNAIVDSIKEVFLGDNND